MARSKRYGWWLSGLLLLAVISTGLASGVLSDGLISYYNMSDTSTQLTDSNRTNNLTEVTGTPVWGADGKIGTAVNFSLTQQVNSSNTSLFDFGTGSFTVSFWAKTSKIGSDLNVLGTDSFVATSYIGWYFQREGSANKWRFTTRNSTVASHETYCTSPTSYTGTDWVHVVGTRNGTNNTIYLYINGSLVIGCQEGAGGNNVDSTGKFKIGQSDGTATNRFNGTIDEVGVWNRQLSASEISVLFNSGRACGYNNLSGSSVNCSAPSTPATEYGFSISDTNSYDASAISTFNATLSYSGSAGSTLPDAAWWDDFESYDANYYLERNTYIPQTSNLVAYYSFDGCSLLDKTGTNNLTLQGSTVCTRGVLGNNSFYYDTSGDYLNSTTNLSVLQGNISISVFAWVNTTSQDGQQAIVAKDTQAYRDWFMQIGAKDLAVRLYNTTGTAIADYSTTGDVVPIGQHFLGFTYDRTTRNTSIYVDSVLRYSNTLATSMDGFRANGNPLLIGTYYNKAAGYSFNGSIDDVFLWNTSLTQAEINQLYNRANTTYRPQSGGAAYNVSSGVVSVGNFGVSNQDNKALMCGIGSACVVTKSLGGFGGFTPTVYYRNVSGVANATYAPNLLTISMEAGSAIDDIMVFVNNTQTSPTNGYLFCPTLRSDTRDAIKSCDVIENKTTRSNLSRDLVAYYPFDTNWNASDASGNGNTGTVYGATATSGIIGSGAYRFSAASSQYIDIGNAASLLFNDTETFTVNCWITPSETTSYIPCAAHWGASAAVRNWLLYRTNTNTYAYLIQGGSTATLGASSTGVPAMLTLVYNGTDALGYLNGVYVSNYTKGLTTTTQNLTIGRFSTSYANGTIDEVRIYNRSLSAGEVYQLYLYGYLGGRVNVSGLNFANVSDIELSSSQGSINSNYSIVGGVYRTRNSVTHFFNTTNNSINTGWLQNYHPVTYTLLLQSSGFYNATYSNYNISSNLSGAQYQAVLGFTANEIITNAAVTSYTVNITNTTYSKTNTSTNPAFYLNGGSYSANFSKSGYWPQTTSLTVSSLTSSVYNWSVYQYLINVSATYSNGTALSVFSVNATSTAYNYSAIYNTTNGSIYIPWVNDTVTLTLNATNITPTSRNLSLASYVGPVVVNITLAGLTYNTFNMSFYNETSNTLLDNTTIYLQVISDVFAQNYTITNGTSELTFLTPSDYELLYWYDSEVPRSYYVTLTEQSYNNLRLYLIDEEVSSLYLPVEIDEVGVACSNNTVSMLRYYIDINGYRTVEMAKTDTNGQAVLRVQPNIINYKLVFVGECGNYTTAPQKFTASTNTFTVTSAQSPLTSIIGMDDVAQSLTFNNVSNTFVYTWVDSGNLITSACLKVTMWKAGVSSVVNNNCSTGGSGSLIYSVTDTNQTRYQATATLYTNTEYSTYSDSLEYSFLTDWQTWGLTGVFLTAIVVIAFALLSLGSADTTIIGGVAAIGIMGLFGIIAYNYTVLIGIFIVAAIMVYKTKGT